jgi:hypothetical protein
MERVNVEMYDVVRMGATEAAYTCFARIYAKAYPNGQSYDQIATIPQLQGDWPIKLKAISTELIAATGEVCAGALVRVLALGAWGTIGAQIAGGVQSWMCRNEWHGEMDLNNGFGVFIYTPAITSGCILTTRAIYESREVWRR